MNINLDNLKDKNKMKNVILTCLLTVTVISLSFAQLKVVAPDGDVGIGITDPAQKLHVKGITRITPENGTTDPAVLQVGAGRTGAGLAFIDTYPQPGPWMGRLLSNSEGVTTFSHQGSMQFQIRTFGTAPLWFVAGNQSRLTILSSGNVGIGTNSPTAMFHVNGSAVKPGGGDWGTASDAKLKSNVQSFTKGIDAVMQINPVTFNYNGKAGIEDTETVHTGIIAQEFQKISPESIFRYKHTEVTDLGDDKGFKTGATEEYLGVDPSQITYMLVNAVKEQQAIINDLKDQVAEMSKVGFSAPAATDHIHYSTVVLNGEEEKALLAQNAPNPFTENTKIDYYVPTSSKAASVSFTDITGKEVKRINIDHTGLGTLDVSIKEMPIGIYSYSLVIDGSTIASKKMVLSK